MAIESRCSGCGKLLRVADEHAGKKARCPECGHIYVVPQPGAVAGELGDIPIDRDVPAPASTPSWYMKTPEGQTYGPVDREQLDRWVREGRITHDCQLRNGSDATWCYADEVFPVLRPQQPSYTPAASASSSSYGAPRIDTSPGYASGGMYGQSSSGYLRPHRGGTILVFAILGWFICPIFAVIAWSMGSDDLNRMRLGQMDRSGMGPTQAGQILGMIICILYLISFAFFFLACACGAIADAFG